MVGISDIAQIPGIGVKYNEASSAATIRLFWKRAWGSGIEALARVQKLDFNPVAHPIDCDRDLIITRTSNAVLQDVGCQLRYAESSAEDRLFA